MREHLIHSHLPVGGMREGEVPPLTLPAFSKWVSWPQVMRDGKLVLTGYNTGRCGGWGGVPCLDCTVELALVLKARAR